MSPDEYTALKELLGENIYYASNFFFGNLPFLIPTIICLFIINRRYKKASKPKKVDPSTDIS